MSGLERGRKPKVTSMNILGLYISKLSGIWILAGCAIAYAIVCWGLCKAAGDADERIWK